MASNQPPLYDLSLDLFDRHLSTDEARALYEVLENIGAKNLILFSSTTTEAWHASQAVEKLTTWLLTRAMVSVRKRDDEPPDDK